MKIIRILAAASAAVIMTACSADEPAVIDPPAIELPHSSTVYEQYDSPADTAITERSGLTSLVSEITEEPSFTPDTTEPVQTSSVTQEAPPTAEAPEQPQTVEPEEEPDPLDYGAHFLTAEEMEFVERSIFVGDSICKGYGVYNIIDFDRVFANGSMGTRNFWDYTFAYITEDNQIPFGEVLELTQPELVFLSMGMNDINMLHPDEYCSKYSQIINAVLEQSQAVVYLCAMTPVRGNFTSNERVDYFNNGLEELAASYPERVYYVNYGVYMLNDEGLLNNQLDGGDGVHLSPYAYRIALWEIYRTLVEDGTLYPEQLSDATVETVEITDEPVTAEVSTEEAFEVTAEAATEEAFEITTEAATDEAATAETSEIQTREG